MGDFSVKAVLSAVDRNFSNTMKSAMSYTNNLKSTLTSGLGFGIMMGAGQAAFSSITGSVKNLAKEAIDTSDSMQKLQQAMRFSGSSEAEIQRIAGSTGTLKTYADKTVFSLQDVMNTFGALSANGIKDADKMTESVGNAVAVFGGGAKEFGAVGLAFSQAMAAGALHAQDWNQILNASPQLAGGLKKELIKLNPVLGKDFKGAMEGGAISADLLGQAMNNIGMTKLAKDAAQSVTTFEGAMGNMKATVSSGLAKLYDSFAKSKIVDAINGLNAKIGAGFDWMSNTIPVVIKKLAPYWDVFKNSVIEVKDAFGKAVGAIGDGLGKLTGAFGSTKSVKGFADIMGVATEALKKFAGFLEDHADTIAKVITQLPKLLIAYKGFKIVKAIAPGLGLFTKGIVGLTGKGIGGIASKLFGVSKGQKAVGSAGTVASGGLTSLKTGLNSLQKSAGIALIIGALAGLALAIKPLAALGATAVPPLLAFGVVVGGLAIILGTMGSKLQTSAVGIGVFAGAVSIMALAMAPIAQTGLEGATAMGAFGLVVAGLVVVFALFGTALNAAVPGMLAFGATILAVGAGMALASVLINALTPFIKQLGDTVSQVAASIAGAVTSIIGAFSGLVSTIANAVSQIVTAIGSTLVNVMQTAGDVITGIVDSISDGFLKISDGVSNVVDSIGGAFTGVLEAVADVINSIGTSAKNAGAGFKSVAQGIKIISDLSLIDIAKSLGAVALGMGQMSAQGKGLETAAKGMNGIITGISAAAAGIALFTASLVQMNALGTSVAAGMETIKASLTGFTIPPIDIAPILTAFAGLTAGALALSTQMKAAGGQAGVSFSSAMISGCSGAMGAVQNAVSAITAQIGILPGMMRGVGTQAGNGFRTALQSGLSPIPKIAADTMNKFNSELRTGGNKSESIMRSTVDSIVEVAKSASDRMRSCGYYIGEGLASGMRASLGEVEAVASQLASAAEKAVRAKAKIKSPSKVFRRLGEYIGEGLTLGIESMRSAVERAGENLVAIPEIPDLSTLSNGYLGGARELNNDYDYSQTIYVNAEVKSIMDGREVGYGSAKYVEEKNNFDSARRDRLGGKTNV